MLERMDKIDASEDKVEVNLDDGGELKMFSILIVNMSNSFERNKLFHFNFQNCVH